MKVLRIMITRDRENPEDNQLTPVKGPDTNRVGQKTAHCFYCIVVTQTVLGGLTMHLPLANILWCIVYVSKIMKIDRE